MNKRPIEELKIMVKAISSLEQFDLMLKVSDRFYDEHLDVNELQKLFNEVRSHIEGIVKFFENNPNEILCEFEDILACVLPHKRKSYLKVMKVALEEHEKKLKNSQRITLSVDREIKFTDMLLSKVNDTLNRIP